MFCCKRLVARGLLHEACYTRQIETCTQWLVARAQPRAIFDRCMNALRPNCHVSCMCINQCLAPCMCINQCLKPQHLTHTCDIHLWHTCMCLNQCLAPQLPCLPQLYATSMCQCVCATRVSRQRRLCTCHSYVPQVSIYPTNLEHIYPANIPQTPHTLPSDRRL